MKETRRFRYAVLVGVVGVLALAVAVSIPAASSSISVASPVIKSFTPHRGPVGTQVEIMGTNLLGGSVSFNGVHATVNNPGDVNNDELIALVPQGAGTGAITVSTSGGTATSASVFDVTSGKATSESSKPLISSFAPAKAKPGAMVTVVGSNLGPVKSIKIGSVRVLYYKTISDNRLAIRVPKGARTGKISLATQGGLATSATRLVVK
jgi:hypothetical protein